MLWGTALGRLVAEERRGGSKGTETDRLAGKTAVSAPAGERPKPAVAPAHPAAAAAAAAAPAAVAAGAAAVPQSSGGQPYRMRRMTLWVKCTTSGVPVQPWDCHLDDCSGAGAASASPEPPAAAAPATLSALSPATSSTTAGSLPISQETDASSVPAAAPLWTAGLPKLRLRAEYKAFTGSGAEGSAKRSVWPIGLAGFEVDLSAFARYLQQDRNNGKGQVGNYVLMARRLFHMLETLAGESIDNALAVDPALLAALYTSQLYQEVLPRRGVVSGPSSWPFPSPSGDEAKG